MGVLVNSILNQTNSTNLSANNCLSLKDIATKYTQSLSGLSKQIENNIKVGSNELPFLSELVRLQEGIA